MNRSVFVVSFLLIGLAYAQVDVDSIDDTFLREKCDSRGGKGTYDNVKTARENFQTCVEDLVDIDTLKNEIEESKKTGSMDEVFGKYCRKRPEFKTCLDNFLEKMKLCLTEDEKKNLNTVLDLGKELGEFACFKDGDRIAMFVAEEGPECIKAHVEGIKSCVNNTLKINPSTSVDSFPTFLNATKVCDDLAKIQPCIVKELEKCENTTPANVVDSVFRFIKKRTCKTGKQRRSLDYKKSLQTTQIHVKNLMLTYVNYAKSKCRLNKGQEEIDKLEETLAQTQTCVTDYVKNNVLYLLSPRELKDKIIDCSEDFIEASENCLSEDEKYFPRLSRDITSGFVDLIFKYKQNFISSSWSIEMQQCFQNFKYPSNRQSLVKCFEGQFDQDKIYTKSYVCGRLSKAGECVNKAISSVCVQDISVDEFKEEFQQVFTKPCED